MKTRPDKRLNIAVIGSGISGLSAAWLLSKHHRVVLFEKDGRVGGHSNTVDIETAGGNAAVDTGFIVFNPPAYPNLTALFDHLSVPTAPSDMGFAVSMDGGAYEYAGSSLLQLIGPAVNLLDAGHWRMIGGILRFFLSARRKIDSLPDGVTLAEFLRSESYSADFVDRHLLPMAGAIWSAAPGDMRDYPARAFIRFFDNHGLLKLAGRPQWRTVAGGSRNYVERLVADGCFEVRAGDAAVAVRRASGHAAVTTTAGLTHLFDDVVLATHADEALALLADATPGERRILSAFRYADNRAVLHTDSRLMPKRRWLWSSWNYMAADAGKTRASAVTYWMNRLQPLSTSTDVFVSLNPLQEPRPGTVLAEFGYAHPVFDTAALAAQRGIWGLQGLQNTWFCGAHFGAGFHEDGLQAGLAVAERLGQCRRPWTVRNESGRIHLPDRDSVAAGWLEAAE